MVRPADLASVSAPLPPCQEAAVPSGALSRRGVKGCRHTPPGGGWRPAAGAEAAESRLPARRVAGMTPGLLDSDDVDQGSGRSKVSKIPWWVLSILNAYQVAVPSSAAARSRPACRRAARSPLFPSLASSRARSASYTVMMILPGRARLRQETPARQLAEQAGPGLASGPRQDCGGRPRSRMGARRVCPGCCCAAGLWQCSRAGPRSAVRAEARRRHAPWPGAAPGRRDITQVAGAKPRHLGPHARREAG